MTGRVLPALYRILAGILALVCAVLFIFGLFATILFRQYQENDYPDIHRLPLALTFLIFAALAAGGLLLLRRAGAGGAPRLSRHLGILLPEKWFLAAALFAFCFCAFLLAVIRGLPTNDAKFCIEIAQEFLRGDYSAVHSGYLTIYPFQLSFCLFGEWLTRLFGAGRYVPYQLLNVASILLVLFFLYQIAWELYEDVRICAALSLLSFGCFALYAYSTFIYNDIWSLAPLFGSFWLLVRFLKRGGLARGLMAAFFAACSFFIKSNGAVALVAICGILAVSALRALAGADGGKAIGCILTAAAAVLLSLGMRGALNAHYAFLSGGEVPDGVPAVAYFAMGMTESDGKYGWYNGDNARYIIEAGEGGAEAASLAAGAYLRERAAFLLRHPKTLAKFYLMKFLTQWGDPTAVSLREQELTGRHQEGMRPALAEDLTFGTGFFVMQGVMHFFHLLLFFFAGAELAALAAGKQRLREDAVLLLLFAFGGILFHELWEASGRYTLRYVLAFLPYAAAGMLRMLSLPALKGKKRRDV